MRAARLVAIGAPVELQEVPVPTPGSQEVLVRVTAAGICHSDAHYRSGRSGAKAMPRTLGHEVAGVIVGLGDAVTGRTIGERVVLHYNVTCGTCHWCATGSEQFCAECRMLGHHRDGGWAEFIAVPARNAVPLPAAVGDAPGATLMCASATSYHALRKSRLVAGERVAIFGAGGLGQSAVQLARTMGASQVVAVDLDRERLARAASFGAAVVDARAGDAVQAVRAATGGRGVDVALELVGTAETTKQALAVLAPMGRAVAVGLTAGHTPVETYREILGPEAELIGCNDHLRSELEPLIELARTGALDVTGAVTRTIPLDAALINAALDQLDRYGPGVRTVIVPHLESV
ncbi:MAG: zinc-binding dehydrogenase [Gemmatimonadetes bacterium]|nr:zinc-binding dehydrogenase [Gemmatimonadota bacterium]